VTFLNGRKNGIFKWWRHFHCAGHQKQIIASVPSVEAFACRDGEKPEIFLVVEDTEIRRKML